MVRWAWRRPDKYELMVLFPTSLLRSQAIKLRMVFSFKGKLILTPVSWLKLSKCRFAVEYVDQVRLAREKLDVVTKISFKCGGISRLWKEEAVKFPLSEYFSELGQLAGFLEGMGAVCASAPHIRNDYVNNESHKIKEHS